MKVFACWLELFPFYKVHIIVTVYGNRHISLEPDTIYHGFSMRVFVRFLGGEPLGMAALRKLRSLSSSLSHSQRGP